MPLREEALSMQTRTRFVQHRIPYIEEIDTDRGGSS